LARRYLEAEVRKWLRYNINLFDPTLKFLREEYTVEESNVYDGDLTGRYGYVDILCGRISGKSKNKVLYYCVEIKQYATTAAIDQVKKYMNWLRPDLPVEGAIAAFDISPKALSLINKDPELNFWHIGCGGTPIE